MGAVDLLVIGGGIVGAAVAYHGARAGGRVLLVDRHDSGRATDAGAGILSPETDIRHGGAYFELARRAAAYYPRLLEALGETAGYSPCGMLVVAVDEEETRLFDAFAEVAEKRQVAQQGGEPTQRLQVMAPAEARELFPPLAAIKRALWSPSAARIDGRDVTASLLEAARAEGAVFRHGSVRELTVANGEVAGATIDAEEVPAARVVLAGGAWSASLVEPLGISVPVAPQRGQIVHLRLEGTQATEGWPMVSGFREHYLLAWPGGRVTAGATRETGSGFDPRVTAAGVKEVLAEALRLAPGLAHATLLETRVGLRPLAADGLPVLGPAPSLCGLWLATGHGPAGLTLGPYTGKLVAEAALGAAQWPSDLAELSVARFREASG